VDSATIELRGSRENHQITARTIGDSATVTLEASGSLRNKSWQGEVGQLSIETAEAGEWEIERSFRLAVTEGSVELDEACLTAREGGLCLGGSWSSESGWRVAAALERLPLTLLQPALPDGWALAASLSGDVSGTGAGTRVEQADLNIQIGSGALEYPTGDLSDALRFNAVNLTVYADADSLSGDFAFELADTSGAGSGRVSGRGFLPGTNVFTREMAAEGLNEAFQEEWRLSLSIDTVSLSLLDRFMPEAMRLTGSLNGSLVGSAKKDGALTANLEIIAVDASLVRILEEEAQTLELVEPALQVRIDSAGLWGEAQLAAARPDSAPHLTLSGTLRLPEYNNFARSMKSERMEANLNGAIDLSLLDALVGEFSGTTGRLAVDLAARGTLAEPEVSGRYDATAQTDVPALGIQLREVEVTAAAGPEGNLDIRGGLSSGDGRLEITGEAPIIPSSENPGRLKVRGTDFLAVENDQTRLVVSPDLEVAWTGTSVDVTGDVTIPRATIEIIEMPETSVRVSKDVVLVGVESQPSRPVDVSANIRLLLGEEILFKGFGFTTNVEGTLQLIEQPGTPTRGRGELVLREGVYRGYGQNLTIDPGRLVFAGPIDDPGLSVRAYRRATDGTRAGFLIGGTLKSPELQVWSDPAMSESAVLSYVLFGRSPEEGSGSQQAQAGSAAAILGGNMLAMSMASRVGLDDARVEAGARQEDAAFYAGKYLSPKLYVAYGTGLFEPIDVIRVRYLISSKLTLQAETGTRDSGDILYRIER
jgi:translocation and assembly module TamB